MPLDGAYAVLGVEAAPVVADGEEDAPRFDASSDLDFRCGAVAYGVARKFPDDGENGVCRRVLEAAARNVEAHFYRGVAVDLVERPADGRGEVGFVQRVASKVEEALPELRAAGVEHLVGRFDAASRDCGVAVQRFGACGHLAGDAGELLGERVVEFDGEPCALVCLEFRDCMGDLLAVEFAAALAYELLQYPVPDVYADQRGDKDGNHDKQPERGPPRRAGDYPKVFGRADYGDQIPYPREDVVRGPLVDFKEAAPRDLEFCAKRYVCGGGAVLQLTKEDLKALGQLRGLNEKHRLFTITPQGNGNRGVIADGGVQIPYVLLPENATTGLAAGDLIYGDPMNYLLGLFGGYEIRVDDSVKSVERMHTILGDVLLGGNVVEDKGFVYHSKSNG